MKRLIQISIFLSIISQPIISHGKVFEILPVKDDKIICEGVVEIDGDFTSAEIFKSAEFWLKKVFDIKKDGRQTKCLYNIWRLDCGPSNGLVRSGNENQG